MTPNLTFATEDLAGDGMIDIGIDERPFGLWQWIGEAILLTIFLTIACGLWALFMVALPLAALMELIGPVIDGDYATESLIWRIPSCVIFSLWSAFGVFACFHGIICIFEDCDPPDEYRCDRLSLSGDAGNLVLSSRNAFLGKRRIRKISLHDLVSVSSSVGAGDESPSRQIVVTCRSRVHRLDLSWVQSDADLAATLRRLREVLGLDPREGVGPGFPMEAHAGIGRVRNDC